MPLVGQLQSPFGLRLALGPPSQELKDGGSKERCLRAGIGMVELLRQLQRRLHLCHGLLRIALQPQRPGQEEERGHSRVVDLLTSQVAIPARVVEGDNLLEMPARTLEISLHQEGLSQREVNSHYVADIPRLLGQLKKPFPFLASFSQLPVHHVE